MFYYLKDESASVADMNCYDWNSVNSTIYFDELIAKKDDGYYYLFLNCQSFTNCKKSKDDLWKFPPDTKVRIKLATSPYEKTDFKTKQKTTVQPSRLEKALVAILEEKGCDKHLFKGSLSLSDSPMVDSVLSGKDISGVTIPGIVLDSYKSLLCQLQQYPLEGKKYFKDEELVAPKARGNFAKPSQTHYEKLNDKFYWLKTQLLAKYPALAVESYYDITAKGMEEQRTTEEVKKLAYEYVLELNTFLSL